MRKPTLRKVAVGATIGLFALALAAPPGFFRATASSHREAPAISQDPAADHTDVYAFVSPDNPNTVTLIANVWPFSDPASGPNFVNFGDDVQYDIKIDNNGDNLPDITYRWQFKTNIRNPNTFLYNTGPIKSLTDPNWNLYQTYNITRITSAAAPTAPPPAPGSLGALVQAAVAQASGGSAPSAPAASSGGAGSTVVLANAYVPPWNIGPASTPNYDTLANGAIYSLPNGGLAFAGPRDDPFYVDLGATFDLLTIRPGAPGNKGGGRDTLAGLGVLTMAIQVPISSLTAGDPVIGVWATSSRANSAGVMTQISRLGNPLVNEVVIPLGLKNAFNGLTPDKDAATLSTPDGRIPLVQDPEPARLLKALYGINVPPIPRNDLVAIFLTGIPQLNQPKNGKPAEVLRLNTSIAPSANPSRMGLLGGDTAGYPNGRRLADDVVDIALQAVAGGTPFTPDQNVAPNNQLGDGVDSNDRPFLSSFPYMPAMLSGFDS